MNEYKKALQQKMDEYVHWAYGASKQFPRDELYGATSQFRRAAMSMVLNYIEGYARIKPMVQLNFFETAYGSLKESEYIIDFAHKEDWLNEESARTGKNMADEIGAMLWKDLSQLREYAKNRL